MLRVGVAGFGYWGPNIVRNFCGNDKCRVVKIFDTNEESLKRAQRAYSHIERVSDWFDVISDPNIDAVAIITPVSTHYELAKQALANGKHIFVAKPFTATTAQAEELIEMAERRRLKIMIDHTFLFTGAVRTIKQLIDQDEIGKIYYYDSTRVNLGLFQHDANVIWDLAPHDIAIIDYVIREKPEAVVATGRNHFNTYEDVAYVTVYFSDNLIAHLSVNWLSPVKVRTTLIGGAKRMLVWNDLNPDEKIKIYDKGVDIRTKEGVYDLLVSYRSGEMRAPKVDQTEALKIETDYFCDCIANDEIPFNDGYSGLRVVKILEAAEESLKNRGKLVYL